MKSILALTFLFSSFAFAGTWDLSCTGAGYNGRTDVFSAIMNSDLQQIRIETPKATIDSVSADMGTVDLIFHPAEFSPKLQVVHAYVSTYNYFSGRVTFYLGAGLESLSGNSQIAVEFDDGDGFGFDKRSYNCNVVKR